MFYSGPRRPGRPRPGKTSRYRRASLDRAGEGTRPYVCFSISKICCGSVHVLLYSEILHTTAAELIHVRREILQTINPAIQPGITVGFCFCLLVILAKECVITLVISLYRRGMRPVPALHHRIDQKSRNHGPIRIGRDYFRIDNFFHHHDHALRRAHAFNHHAEISPAVSVALTISALDVHNGDVWVQSSHCPQRLFRRKWRKYLIEKMIPFRHIAAQRGLRGEERHAHCPSLQRERDGEVGHVENLHPVLLDGAAEVVTRAHHDVANPCGNYLLNTSCADHLVEQNV